MLTWENLPPSLQERTVIWTGTNYQEIQRLCPTAQVIATSIQGAGGPIVKQHILEQSLTHFKDDVCVLLDDDLQFQYGRIEAGVKRFKKASSKEIEQGFADCLNKVAECLGFVCLGTPFFNKEPAKWVLNKKGCYAFFIKHTIRIETGASFSGVPTMGDVHFCLGTATKGYGSALHSRLVAVDSSKSSTGGESAVSYRGDRHEQAIKILQEKWPKYVKDRLAENNQRHRDNVGTVQDVTIYFSRAVKDHSK